MDKYIELALKEAKKSLKTEDVPVGAIIVENGKIISKAHNTKEKNNTATKHAEINAIEKACKKKKNWHLDNCTLYVTLEPCDMCRGAIKSARIKQVIYITKRTKIAQFKTKFTYKPEKEHQSEKMLKNFFKTKRKKE